MFSLCVSIYSSVSFPSMDYNSHFDLSVTAMFQTFFAVNFDKEKPERKPETAYFN